MDQGIPLESVSRIGFGCYRVAQGVASNYAALAHALSLGCTLIDTASNYADGRSEALVGEVLHDTGHPAFVVTKAGYITPAVEHELRSAGIHPGALPALSAESKYSLAPDVLEAQIALSLRRLRRRTIDTVLLHNPEHIFDCGSDGRAEDVYATIKRAFEVLEEHVSAGMIRYYGVSSNTLAAASHPARRIRLSRLLDAARAVSSTHHFKVVEFPFNLVETEARTVVEDGSSLLDDIKAQGLIGIANRPLNGNRGGELLRLATYDDGGGELAYSAGIAIYEHSVELIQRRLVEHGLFHDVMDFMVMQFLRDNWHGVEHPDTVDLIFQKHFYPFVQSLWEDAIPDHAQRTFAALHQQTRTYAQRKLTEQGHALRTAFIEAGTIAPDDARPLATIACDFCLRSGADHAVVGMRNVRYVDSLRSLF